MILVHIILKEFHISDFEPTCPPHLKNITKSVRVGPTLWNAELVYVGL